MIVLITSWTFPLRHKSDTFPTLSHFFVYVSTQFGCIIQSVQCDNGREFDNSTRTFFLSHGVQLWMSCPYTSLQNDGIRPCTVGLCGPLHGGYRDNILEDILGQHLRLAP
jgi:hypothetical protein